MSKALRADVRLACTNGVQKAAGICKQAYELGGGGSVYLDSALQRRFRDAHVMTQHITCAPALYGLAGRVLLGIETNSPCCEVVRSCPLPSAVVRSVCRIGINWSL